MNTNLTVNGRNDTYKSQFSAGAAVQQAGRMGSPVPAEHTEPKPDTTISPIQTGPVDHHYDTDASARPALGAAGDTHAKAQSGV